MADVKFGEVPGTKVPADNKELMQPQIRSPLTVGVGERFPEEKLFVPEVLFAVPPELIPSIAALVEIPENSLTTSQDGVPVVKVAVMADEVAAAFIL